MPDNNDPAAELAARLREVLAERERLLDLLEDAAEEYFDLVKDGKYAGWYDSGARRTACDIGNALVKWKRWEKHPDGYGRRWHFRPIEKGDDDE